MENSIKENMVTLNVQYVGSAHEIFERDCHARFGVAGGGEVALCVKMVQNRSGNGVKTVGKR